MSKETEEALKLRLQDHSDRSDIDVHFLPTVELNKVERQKIVVNDLLNKEQSSTIPLNPLKDKESGVSSKLFWVIGILFLLIITFISFQYSKSKKSTLEVAAADKFLPDQKEESNDTEKLFAHPTLAKYKDILTEDVIESGCVVIVGTFKNEPNAAAMVNQIKLADFEPYQELNEGLVRVGVIFDCTSIDLEEFLFDVRNQFSSSAWYLRPQIEF